MKKFPVLALSGALVLVVAGAVPAELVEKTTTSETTYRGTVSEINPNQIRRSWTSRTLFLRAS